MKPRSPRRALLASAFAAAVLSMTVSLAAPMPSAWAADANATTQPASTGAFAASAGAFATSTGAFATSTGAFATSTAPSRPLMLAQATVEPSGGAEAPPSTAGTNTDAENAHAEAVMHTARFRALAHELRCLVCQNQTLLDSHADLAKDLRLEVVRLIDSGMDDRQIKTYLVDRYGEFVLYRPTWSLQNSILWGGPAVMLLAAGFGIWRLTRRRRLAADDDPDATETAEDAPEDAALRHADAADGEEEDDAEEGFDHLSTDEALKQVDALLGRDRS